MKLASYSLPLIPPWLKRLSLVCTMTVSSTGALSAQGPGLGNLSYSPGEVFTQISPSVDNAEDGSDSGFLPPDYPYRKDYGVNVATMVNGYLIGIFAPDSGRGPGGWIALDASNPRNLELVKRVYEPDNTSEYRTGNDLRTAEFREPHSIGLAENNLVAIQTGRGIEIWDWSDVENPVQDSRLRIDNVNYGDYTRVSWQLFWQAPYLYVSRGPDGLTIVDTSDVHNPIVVKTIPKNELGGFNIGPVFALGNELYLSSMETTDGFSILDISNPVNPTLTKSVSSLPDKYYSSCWDGKRAYFGARSYGNPLRIYDTTTNPMALVNEDHSGFVNLYCNLQDDRLLLGNQEDIAVLDIGDLDNITRLGTGSLDVHDLSHSDHGQVFPMGNLVWVGNDHGSGSALIAQQTEPDTLPPQVHRTVPGKSEVKVPLSSRIGIAFSDSILMESVNSNTFKVTRKGETTPLPGLYSVNLGFVHFSPKQELEPNQIYEVTLNGIQDFAGNAQSEYSFSFSTGDVTEHDISIQVPRTSALGQTITLRANAAPIDGGTVEYSWDFGDGSPFSEGSIVSHTYTKPGHWNPAVTVRESGLESSKSTRVTIYQPATPTRPVTSSTLIHAGYRVIAVNEDNNSVSAMSATSPFDKEWIVDVGERPRTLAEAPNGDIWVVNQDSSSITILDPEQGSIRGEIALPRASQPYGIVFSPDQTAALVTLQATGELLKLDPSSHRIIDRADVGLHARGIAVDYNSGYALVTRFVSPQDHAEVVKVDINNMGYADPIILAKDTETFDGPDRSRGIPNYLNSVTIAPDGRTAWVPSNKANVDRGAYNEDQDLTFETTVRAIVSQIDLQTGLEVRQKQLDFDNRAQPKSVVFSALGDYVYVAMEGQNSVEVRDAYTNNRVNEIVTVGDAPRGLVRAGDFLFVHGFLSRTITVFDVSDLELGDSQITRLKEFPTVANEKLNSRVLAGKKIFYNAVDPRMSSDGYLSCASCHTGGDSDGRVWDFTQRGEGLRNSISLLGRRGMGNGNVHWTANFDEIQDFENDIRSGFGGVGFLSDAEFNETSDPLGNPKAGLNSDLDNLAFYVSSLNKYPRSPYRNQDGSLTSEAQRGKQLFSSKGCQSCHSGPFYTDNSFHDVGTIEASSGSRRGGNLDAIETPTLIGLAGSAPYFHNGQAETLDQVLLTGSEHTVTDAVDRARLVAFLEQIEYEGTDVEVPSPPAGASYVYLSDLDPTDDENGYGPIQINHSNGGSGDEGAGGNKIRINGTEYDKGLGVHAYSKIIYDISKKGYNQFSAYVGVDDEVSSNGSVIFKVYVDDETNKVYESTNKLTGKDGAEKVEVSLEPGNYQLILVVEDAGDGNSHDHADWADAKLRLPSVDADQPGLYYGTVSGNLNKTAANPKTAITVDLSETEDNIAQNTTEIFSGYIYDEDGYISFKEHMDDKVLLLIDGNEVLNDGKWNSETWKENLKLSPGWHRFELRISNGSGLSGPTSGIGFAMDPDGGTNWIHPEDPGDGSLFRTSAPEERYEYVSDLQEDSSVNGWGPIEKNRSNGEKIEGQEGPLTIRGTQYEKGLGVHSYSEVTYTIDAGKYNQFSADIGIDDEVKGRIYGEGSVKFEVRINGNSVYESQVLTGFDNPARISVPIPSSATEVKLIVHDGGDGGNCDHADWANARFRLTP
ncbi:hypothetical protein BTA51_26490 [Hahella sp. CCB-MM4]|uniref:NPCBM/NEW2 domain-containing protein n=1 Tax=Hahella sp. (strain CCB-MM4) TaxID=1926491 RepID=UPI000B9B1A0C|nr:NPCBM/NEW2 domain-containing protein [Hahella sp. CCB-MM4]OZG70391.1 hypothetical protein BTA51_26490 [Hahella sp. CCB-MM4]